MIHINIEGKQPPKDWCDKAEELTKKLKDLNTPEERKTVLKNSIWRDKALKDWLLALSHGKCWYSEAKEIYSFFDVDHFRPKGRAKQLDKSEREGYWWLTFDWKNYRICGNIGNRPNRAEDNETRGKADYFPLKEGSPVAKDPACSDLHTEHFYLLDPANPDDPLLLTFDEFGEPQPATPNGTWEYERARVTIDLLHLDYPPLVSRRQAIWSDCRFLIDQAQNLMKAHGNFIVTRFGQI